VAQVRGAIRKSEKSEIGNKTARLTPEFYASPLTSHLCLTAHILDPFPVKRLHIYLQKDSMKTVWPVLLRVVVVFAAMAALQYLVPFYLLAPVGLVAGFFLLKTSDDRAMALGLLIGSVIFGIFAWVMTLYFPLE
jgi:hypothetical protein